MSLKSTFDPARAAGIDESYRFELDGTDVLTVTVADGTITTTQGATSSGAGANPAVTIRTSSKTIFDIGYGHLDPAEAQASGAIEVVGKAAALRRAYALFGPGRFSRARSGH